MTRSFHVPVTRRAVTAAIVVSLVLAGSTVIALGTVPSISHATQSGGAPPADAPEASTGGTASSPAAISRSDAVHAEVNLSNVTSNQTAALGQVGSVELRTETRTSDQQGTLIESQTIRVNDSTRRLYARQRQVLKEATTDSSDGQQTTKTRITTDYFANGSTVFVRKGANGNTSHYERQRTYDWSPMGNPMNESASLDLATQFDFGYERLQNGDHMFTVTSPNQIEAGGPPADGIEDVSVRIRVDNDTGLVTYLRYELVVRNSTTNQRLSYVTVRVLDDVGNATVPTPKWISEAKNRTDPLLVRAEPYVPPFTITTETKMCGRNTTTLTDTYNSNVDAIPGAVRGVVTDATIHGIVNGDDDRNYTISTGADRRISDVHPGVPDDASVEVETDCNTVTTVVDAENTTDAFVRKYNAGDISVRGTNPLSTVVVEAVKAVVKIGQWIGLV